MVTVQRQAYIQPSKLKLVLTLDDEDTLVSLLAQLSSPPLQQLLTPDTMFLLSTTQTFFWVNNCISIDLHFPFSPLSSVFLRAHPPAVFYPQGDGRSWCLHASSRVTRSPCSTQQCRCSSPSLLGCTQFPYYFFPRMSIALNQRQVPWREMLMHLL